MVNIIVEYAASAFKHNISAADIYNAILTPVYDDIQDADADKHLLLGFDRTIFDSEYEEKKPRTTLTTRINTKKKKNDGVSRRKREILYSLRVSPCPPGCHCVR
jgi:hypothetical protein